MSNRPKSAGPRATPISPELANGQATRVAGQVGQSETVTIVAPLGSYPLAAYVARRCDVQQLTEPQRSVLKRLARGLSDSGATLANGKVIRSESDAIKWLLEGLAGERATVKP